MKGKLRVIRATKSTEPSYASGRPPQPRGTAKIITLHAKPPAITQKDLIEATLLSNEFFKAKRAFRAKRVDILDRLRRGADVEYGHHFVYFVQKGRPGRESVAMVIR
jgi:hypothetical protein